MEFSELLHVPSAALLMLIGAVVAALAFEAVNGFHDAANAVATVIYTNSLKPRVAVVLSGICNFIGVYLGGMGVAFAIVHLLPVDLLANVGSSASTAMIFAILIAAIAWNVGTWYRGIPASSSHTLIGAIIGVGVANALVQGEPLFRAANFGNVQLVLLSLLISPLLGFALAALFLWLLKTSVRDKRLYEPPQDGTPPAWVRGLLVLTCTGVSLAHGSNDGQKGVGLLMIILVGILPAHFALNLDYGVKGGGESIQSLEQVVRVVQSRQSEMPGQAQVKDVDVEDLVRPCSSGPPDAISQDLEEIVRLVQKHDCLAAVSYEERSRVRKNILLVENRIKDVEQSGIQDLTDADKAIMKRARTELRTMTDYAPTWVVLLVATAIGLGTMVGWKRVVTTVGEKIGKDPLTFGQGASSEMVAMITIGLADVVSLPVSTTHVLSSGVTGTMVANGVGLRYGTLRDIALAWVLTFPVTALLGALLFLVFHWLGA